MSQEMPLADEMFVRTQNIMNRFLEMTADGCVCEEEQEEVQDDIAELFELSELTMKSQAAGVAMMRRGPDSIRARRLVRNIEVNAA